MHGTEEFSVKNLDRDHIGKVVVVHSRFPVQRPEDVADSKRSLLIPAENGYILRGFVLGRLLGFENEDSCWVRPLWDEYATADLPIKTYHILGVLLDDEPEPDVYQGLTRIVG